MRIIKQKTKTLKTKDNGRSSDAVSPNFIYGCLGGCMKSYCYVGRYNNDRVYINENTPDILESIADWVDQKPWPRIPAQTDDKYYVIEIGCSTDIPLHLKSYNWQVVFDFFNEHYMAKSTFATKYPSLLVSKLSQYNLEPNKHRVRVSLMPQVYSSILEPHTDSIQTRIDSIPKLQEQFEVHINFSPIIYTDNWLDEYRKLFEDLVKNKIDVKCECIFLTYNEIQFKNNSQIVNDLCWNPSIQETKNSQYADNNIRYKWQLKNQMISDFCRVYSEYFSRSNIRYIF